MPATADSVFQSLHRGRHCRGLAQRARRAVLARCLPSGAVTPRAALATLGLTLMTLITAGAGAAQETGTLRVQVVDAETGAAVDGAAVESDGVGALTNRSGEATLRLAAGEREVNVGKIGYAEAEASVLVPAGGVVALTIQLEVEAEEVEGIVVTTTRTERRIEDEPVRVEVLPREEIEEKLLMTPGDIAMMLNESSGLRVQNTSPSLGGANVRIQGLRGRYTQILSDGLPLYGGQTGSLGMLQIPPMDLGQVEVIKGAASALYGSTALGGVINLISRRPEEDERELLLNQSTLGGTDGVLWASDRLGRGWGYTLLGGAHRQTQADVDEDGWADVPGYERLVARPRVFWDDGAGRSVFATFGGTVETREGGTRAGEVTPAGIPYPEALETRRGDFGVVGRMLLGGAGLLTARGSAMAQRHEHRFGETVETDLHSNAFAEVTYAGAAGRHQWLVGAAVQSERYDARDVVGFDFTHTVPSLLAQDEVAFGRTATVSASARLDRHSEYGAFISPRLSLLVRPAPAWTLRASGGTGYFAPTPFTEETEAVGLLRLLPLDDVEAERAVSLSADLGYERGPIELNGTLFRSEVRHPVQARSVGGALQLVNAQEPTRSWGAELLAGLDAEPFHVTATYAYLRSTEADPQGPGRREVPLNPRHTAGIVAMWEAEGVGRIGAELYFTGRQALDDNPYRSTSRPYVVTGLLVERRFGRFRAFMNAENLLDARQTRWDPLVLPTRAPEGRWTTDAWAPLEGRAVNGGVRIDF